MTTTTSSAARCDRIISMIDACLAEVTIGFRLIAGDDRSPTPTLRSPRPLTAVPN